MVYASANNHSRRGGDSPRKQQYERFILMAGLLGFFAVWLFTPLSHFCTQTVLNFVPFEADVQLGQEAWQSMKYEYPPVQDVWGVELIGRQLIGIIDKSTYQTVSWDFGVVHSPNVINAFALPGGVIRVTDALLNTLQLSDAELAALIGHEMGHVLHRHSQARLLQNQLFTYLLNAIIYEDNDGYEESFGEALGELLLKSASFLTRQSFSRQDEYEADATAWELTVNSKIYSPKGVESLLKKLWTLQGGSGQTSWESTHPGTKDRIVALKTKWDDLSVRQRRRLNQYPIQ